ncbi:MAG: sugar ABC transporter ATP-binding protein [Christensenellales bacterium]
MMTYSLEMKGMSKSFYGVRVLQNVDFRVKPGTVHALCGENGAGKSTLMKMLAGIYSVEEGEILLKGKKVVMHKPIDAIRNGIAMIHQELSPIKGMKVSENIYLGHIPGKYGLVDYKELNKKADELLKEMNCNIKANTTMGRLKVADQQLVEIAKAVYYDSDILIMDEPTSALTDREVKILFDVIEKLKKQGIGIIYISHKMDEVFHISDEITVLRDGELIGSWQTKDVDFEHVLYSMVGRKLDQIYPPRQSNIGETILEVKDLKKENKFYDVNFNVKRGEVLGVVGLMGAGRTEVMEALFGVTKRDSGTVIFKGKSVNFTHPSQAYESGMGFVTEDRKRFGLFLAMSIMKNITVASMKLVSSLRWLISSKAERDVSKDIYEKLQIKSRHMRQLVRTLSGGNQQKVVLAKVLLTEPDLLILDEPTRGIDVGAKHEIYKIMNDICSSGKAVIFISSELPEILGMSDRIVVFSNKTVVGELKKDEFDQTEILRLAMSNL